MFAAAPAPLAETQERPCHWGEWERPPEASLPGRAFTEPLVLVRWVRSIRKELRLRGQGHSSLARLTGQGLSFPTTLCCPAPSQPCPHTWLQVRPDTGLLQGWSQGSSLGKEASKGCLGPLPFSAPAAGEGGQDGSPCEGGEEEPREAILNHWVGVGWRGGEPWW